MNVVTGNVLETSFTEIWNTSPILNQLRDVKNLKGRCGDCEFNKLCGGCRCRAFASTGDYLQEDPACTYQPDGRLMQTGSVMWSREAQERLDRIPLAFIRDKVRKGLEAYAQRNSIQVITAEVMKEGMAGMERPRWTMGER